jgi:hypothetical protein
LEYSDWIGNALIDRLRLEYSDWIGNALIDRLRHSNALDVGSLRAADCDTGHYLVVAKVRERPAVSKYRSQDFIWRGSISLSQTR